MSVIFFETIVSWKLKPFINSFHSTTEINESLHHPDSHKNTEKKIKSQNSTIYRIFDKTKRFKVIKVINYKLRTLFTFISCKLQWYLSVFRLSTNTEIIANANLVKFILMKTFSAKVNKIISCRRPFRQQHIFTIRTNVSHLLYLIRKSREKNQNNSIFWKK